MVHAVLLEHVIDGSSHPTLLLLRDAMLGLFPLLQEGLIRLPYQKKTKMVEFGLLPFAACAAFS